ncbi:MAG: SGNH/GDSL hydrolase family protein [Clostridia bacterium]|nr:SGNH/GDSL hydrolase family protein [Clostridia bacterium]
MKILFQGDSVTDCGRDRSNPHDMGDGYCRYASAMIQDTCPDTEFEFLNLGISGNRTENLVERLESDFIDVKPDIVSVMIGINDVWHRVAIWRETTDEAFEANLRLVLGAVRARTDAKILVIQPFLLFGGEAFGLREELVRKQAVLKKLADEFADAYLPMDDLFREQPADPTQYSEDGIHPNADGALFIGEAYLKTVMPLIEDILRDDSDDED